MHGLDQSLEQLLAVMQPRPALFQTFKQLVDGRAQLFQRLRFALKTDAAHGVRLARELRDLRRELAHGTLVAPSRRQQYGDTHG